MQQSNILKPIQVFEEGMISLLKLFKRGIGDRRNNFYFLSFLKSGTKLTIFRTKKTKESDDFKFLT